MKNTGRADWILRLIKGMFIGSGFILPGVSGGALAAAALLDGMSATTGTVRLSHNALLLTVLGAGAMAVFSASAVRRRGGPGQRYTLRVWLGGRRLELDGLLDTGNLLHEPFSGLPVILLDRRLAPRLDGCAGSVVVPFSTAGGGITTVKAVPTEHVEVLLRGRWKCPGDMYLAACGSALAGGVEALLPPAALE